MTRYKDIDFSLTKHPITNDISVKTDISAIKQSLKNLFQLKPYDKPMHPEISGVYDLLFEPLDSITKFQFEQRSKKLINDYEPRIELENLNIVEYPNENGIHVCITFRIKNLNQLESIDLFLERKR